MISYRRHPPTWNTLNHEDFFHRDDFACAIISKYILVPRGIESWYTMPAEDGLDAPLFVPLNSAAVLNKYTKKSTNHTIPHLPFYGKCDGVILNNHFYVFSSTTGAAHRIFLQKSR